MGASSVTGVGPGSVLSVQPVIKGLVKSSNIAPNAITADKIAKAPIVLNTATITLDSNGYRNMPLVFKHAAGVIATLPAATGTGDVYKFYVGITVTSNSYKIKVANATDVLQGMSISPADTDVTERGWETLPDSDTITMNGTTTGGVKGDFIEIVDIASGLFYVKMFLSSVANGVTPFSAEVN